jgi:hypothetical protein
LYTDVSTAEFFLEDASGSLTVRPKGMEMDIPLGFRHEMLSKPRDAREQKTT